jgi:spore coat protein U-like protein
MAGAAKRRMMRRALAPLASLLGAVSPVLHAAVICRVRATPVQFGIYSPLSASPRLSTGTVMTRCRLQFGPPAQVTIMSSFGPGSSGTYLGRTLRLGGNSLLYNLYLDAAHTLIAGNGTGGSSTGSATLNLTVFNSRGTWRETLYGSMPASQDVAPGTYTDTIVVTINY